MNRRSFLTFLGLAPAVVPMAARAMGNSSLARLSRGEGVIRSFPQNWSGLDLAGFGSFQTDWEIDAVTGVSRSVSKRFIHANGAVTELPFTPTEVRPMFKTDGEFDSILDRYAEFKKTYDRIPKQARGSTQDEQLMTDPDEAQALKQIEAGKTA